MTLARQAFFCHLRYICVSFRLMKGSVLAVSPQISPRILSAFERLDQAMDRIDRAVQFSKGRVGQKEYQDLQAQMDGLKEDNLALSEALEAHNETDYDSQFDELKTELDVLKGQNAILSEKNNHLSSMNSDVAARLESLIGTVEQVLEEG
jgi:FtsZ-binding cell division protein ZapB